MSKLLTEPRMIKDLSDTKKKVYKKTEQEPREITYKVMGESSKAQVDELFRIYKESPLNARVKSKNSKSRGDGGYSFHRLVLFEKGDKDFEFCVFRTSFGISITNRIYSSQKKIVSIIYSKGKFYYINKQGKNSILPLTYELLTSFVLNNTYNSSRYGRELLAESEMMHYFLAKFPWIRVLGENKLGKYLNMNVVKEKKLFGGNDINRHVMKVPNNIAKLVMESKAFERFGERSGSPIKKWQEILKYLDGIEHLRLEMLNSHLFYDTCNMAVTLGRKINCRWGMTRFKEEHDKWAREIGNILLDCEEVYKLSIRKEYILFAEFSKFKMFLTNKDLLLEGMMQNHCVGTYINRVNSGNCAIYHVDGYTLQLEIKKEISQNSGDEVKSLIRIQFKGKHNYEASDELKAYVDAKIKEFNDSNVLNEVQENFIPVVKKSNYAALDLW